MTYQRFEDLPVWQEAIRLAEECEGFLLAAKDRVTYSKRDQLDRRRADEFQRNSIARLPADHPMRMEWVRKNGPL